MQVDQIVLEYSKSTAVLNKLTAYFQKQLMTNIEPLNYFLNRGFDSGTIEKFKLGYCPSQASFSNFLFYEKIDSDLLVNLGILFKNDEEDSYFTLFSNRVMFPVLDKAGNTLTFSGRLVKDDGREKYVNGKASPIYQKSLALFGIRDAAYPMLRNNLALVVEGNCDVISTHMSGIDYTVATCGSAFTNEYLLIIKQYCNRIIFGFDNDESGAKTSAKVQELLEKDKTIKFGFLRLCEGVKDVDEFILKYGSGPIKKELDILNSELKWVTNYNTY